jgi:hypothetical protein
MKIDANDPRWTAYALGELTDEKERAELEKILSESEEMRHMVEDIRQAAALLNDGLKCESPEGLTQAQRDRIETHATKGGKWFWSRPVWALSAAAACLLMIVSVWVYQLRDGETASTGPESLIADLRKNSTPASQSPQPEAGRDRTKVEIAPYSVTVAGDKENSVKETESSSAADAAEIRTKDATVTGTDAPANTVATSAQDILTASSSSTGTVLKSQSLIEKPLNSQDDMDLINIMGGVQPSQIGNESGSDKKEQSFAGVDSSAIHIDQDGITANDVRYKTGVAGGIPGGVAGGFAGGLVGGFRQEYPHVPAPPPPPRLRPPREEGRIYLPRPPADFNTEGYENIVDNPFLEVTQNPLSTFSIDVDTASYANVRRFLDRGELPPKDAVRIEELVNYFDYDYKGPGREGPFAAHF